MSPYDARKWVFENGYWLYNDEQDSEGWFSVKKGRPSGSTLVGCLGESNFPDSGQWETAMQLAGKTEKKFTPEQIRNMEHGKKKEPEAREWYEKTTGNRVIERGFIVPEWNLHIGVSVDGEVDGEEGIIEIKCPQKMYRPLLEGGDGKIWRSHYLQMQMGMAIMNKKWCDYIVYSTNDRLAYTRRIFFNEREFFDDIYPRLKDFIQLQLDPLLKDTPYPLMPPNT